jgi:hypothetical protein
LGAGNPKRCSHSAPDILLELAIVIVRHRQHASRLVEDLLDIPRIRRGKLQLERTALS